VAVSVAVFFLRQTPVECLEEEAALGSGCLPVAESPQAGRVRLPPLAAAEEVSLPEQLRDAEKPQPLPSGSLTQLQVPSRNTIAGVAGK
jgi:hypothetical protein